MAHSNKIHWSNKSVLALSANEDPVVVVERRARELVLRARDSGWSGPPFNPIAIADLLGIAVEASGNVADARIVATDKGLTIQFNPTQPRERVRFSIAHEIAHTLFPDVADAVRHRGQPQGSDDWQLEMLCNIAASEFVMPLGSLVARDSVPHIEEMMIDRRKYDVSAEAYLIRIAKTAKEPVIMFCASPTSDSVDAKSYRVDYAMPSSSAPAFSITGKTVPEGSAVYSCTAIGYSERQRETWFAREGLVTECVGIPGYPGTVLPRVAGILRFDMAEATAEPIKFVHGDVLDPRGTEPKIICQLVNDRAAKWGGGVARSAAKRFPGAEQEFSAWISSIPKQQRLGAVHFAKVSDAVVIASLVGQEGYGESSTPRIRYAALGRCLEQVADYATSKAATVHMPRIGVGASGGEWGTVEEIVRDTLITDDVEVTVYDLPPRRQAQSPGLFD